MLIAAGWWNPASWLQSAAGFFQGAYSAGGAVLNVLGGVLTILTQFFRFFFDTGQFIADAVNWITNAIFPPELQTWFLGTVGSPGRQAGSTQIYESLYQGMVAPALMIAGVAAAARIIRALADHRTSAMETILSVLPRFLVAVALIGVPGTSVSLGYSAIVWAINASIAVAGAVVGLILNTSFLSGLRPGEGWFSHVYAVLAIASNDMVAVVLGGIPLLILVLYAAFLMIVRTVMLGFCVVTAPLCLATAVFDSNNRFFHWWLDLLGSVLLTPLVLGIAISLSLTLAAHIASAAVVGPILAMVVLCGSDRSTPVCRGGYRTYDRRCARVDPRVRHRNADQFARGTPPRPCNGRGCRSGPCDVDARFGRSATGAGARHGLLHGDANLQRLHGAGGGGIGDVEPLRCRRVPTPRRHPLSMYAETDTGAGC